MQKLLAFLISKRHWILFLLCEVISFSIIYRNNAYQRNIMLSSANVITGSMMSVSNTVFSYLNLRKVNQELLEQNSMLAKEVVRLHEQLKNSALDTTDFRSVFLNDTMRSHEGYTYEYITARAVNNSVGYVNNYITVNKGSADGIRPDMGVISVRGVAGIVVTVKEHYSVIISLLNTGRYKLSCKVKDSNYFGALTWKGDNISYAYLEELPTHAVFHVGDTVVTSGYSAIFPPDIMVGVVESYDKQRDDNFYSLKVRLATDFQSLDALCVISNNSQEEQREIERETIKND
ncbi:MAG: rod shape-determining protein MreC [Tannerella sp.]|jgi:rod shape-determining protein MreC|nr:rod shape-determining protein MreC [Tannerella sp.]